MADLWFVSKENALKEFGVHLRKIRDAKSMSQQQLADEAEISKRAIQKIENGMQNPSLLVLKAIAKALNVSLSSLISYDSE